MSLNPNVYESKSNMNIFNWDTSLLDGRHLKVQKGCPLFCNAKYVNVHIVMNAGSPFVVW